MASKIQLISNALILIGDLPITSLVGNTRAQTVANNLYDNIVHNELTKYRWGFARKKAQLSKINETPVGIEYSTMYQLPSDLLVFIKINPSINYQILGDRVYCNTESNLYCDYIYTVSESVWPAYFSKMVEYALAKDFAMSIRDSASTKQLMNEEYINASNMARYTDSQQHPITPLASRPFVDVRF
jgi:hypothetical protein